MTVERPGSVEECMPYVNVALNMEMSDEDARALAEKVSALASELTGKPERWIMARVEPGCAMCHGGSFAPAAFVEFKSIGLDEGDCGRLSRGVCGLLSREAKVAPERVYIEFKTLHGHLFGWNGGTF
ncbi:hypothetical protein GGQ74_002566 [Desulfobaculum xiamenense]|uniref:L-dopachrome isomerase n=1 Tax=Desulfobaculum xiamenense TaxID=995050 RepID=A0A846QR92_9BACT|nr:phenylpyruvate tautomerase MIF-related protein [Desulfobaculum xiamenense]NJB68893.1 hypothetical protein [Desulfobaculum xiamenense]